MNFSIFCTHTFSQIPLTKQSFWNVLYSHYTCDCTDSYTGYDCETFIPCSAVPCQNNGTCTNAEDYSYYTCTCEEHQYTGHDCELIVPCTGENMCGARACAPGESPFRSFDHFDYVDYYETEIVNRVKRDGFHAPHPQIDGPCYNNATERT